MSEVADALSAVATEPAVETVETPEVENVGIPESDAPAPEPQVEEPTGAVEAAKEPPAKASDVQLRDIAKGLRELREQHPDKAQFLRDLQDRIFRSDAFQRHYATPEEAQRARATFEAIGGEEGLAGLQQAAQAMRDVDEMFQQGDPRAIDAMMKESPDGFKKLVPIGLERLEKLDPQAFNSMMQPHLVKSVLASGLADYITRIAHYAANPNGVNAELMKRDLASVQQWIQSMQDADRQRAQAPAPSAIPDEERQRFAKEKSDLLDQQIKVKLEPSARKSIETSISGFVGKTQITPQVRQFLLQQTAAEIDSMLSKDKVYQNNLSALRARGDVDRIVSYTQATIDSIRGVAAKTVWGRSGQQVQAAPAKPAPKAAARAADDKPTPSADTKPMFLPSKPAIDKLDLNRDPDRLLFMTGKGYLKEGPYKGRLVTWRKPS